MSGKAIRETIGFLAVVAGLVFVGLEIQQNNAIAQAQTRQALYESDHQWLISLATDPVLREAIYGEDAIEPRSSAFFASLSQMRQLENVFLQVREGVVDESVFQTYGWTGRTILTEQRFQDWWPSARHFFDPDFAAASEAEYDLTP